MRIPPQPPLDVAVEIGQAALIFLAEEKPRFLRFLELTGFDPAVIRAQAASPDLLAAVLDHLLADESLLLVFAAQTRLPPDSLAPARTVLGNAAGERRSS